MVKTSNSEKKFMHLIQNFTDLEGKMPHNFLMKFGFFGHSAELFGRAESW